MTEITKEYKKKYDLYNFLSFMMWACTLLFFIIRGISMLTGRDGVFSTQYIELTLKPITISITMSAIIVFALYAFVKEGIRTTVWMMCLIMSLVLYKATGAYIILAIWAVDEYLFAAFARRYKWKYSLQEELDKRGEKNGQ